MLALTIAGAKGVTRVNPQSVTMGTFFFFFVQSRIVTVRKWPLCKKTRAVNNMS